jgi:hypothetical protein
MSPAFVVAGTSRQQRGDHEQVDGQARGAAHERRDEDGRKSVLRVLDGARGHDAGDRARVGPEERDEGSAVQAHAAHRAVHQEGRARHVAGALEQAHEEKQDQDLRQEHHDTAHAAHDALGQQVAQIAWRHRVPDKTGAVGHQPLDQRHRMLREREDGQEHRRHDHSEHKPAPHGVDEERVDPVGE